jgi:hypothetical protein
LLAALSILLCLFVIYVNLVATNNNASHQFCFVDKYVLPSLVHHHQSKQTFFGVLVVVNGLAITQGIGWHLFVSCVWISLITNKWKVASTKQVHQSNAP